MNASSALEQFVKGWETCCLKPHLDHGVWIVGWEHRMAPDDDTAAPITQYQADEIFRKEVAHCASKVDHVIYQPIQQHEFDALVSVALDCGCKVFASSILLKRVNGGYTVEAAEQFELCSGLRERRVAERELFLHAKYEHA